MKGWGPLAGIIFAATLAYVIGIRLSESAMAVVIGVIFGVAASVPASLILILALRNTPARRPADKPTQPQQPTIIVAPPMPTQMPGQPGWYAQGAYLPPMYEGDGEETHTGRRFRVVGED